MIRILLDPKILNYAIMVLFALAAIRWAFAGHLGQAIYWSASLLLTISVTFLMGPRT
jgi:hypothetical protein